MKRALFILPFLAVLLVSCGNSTPAVNTGIVITDPSKPIEVKAGETFEIAIEANPTTGYHWEIVDDPDATLIEFISTEYQTDQPVAPGTGGVDVWTFKAISSGETKVVLGYFPPGQNSTSPEKTAVFDIVIK